jgi:hypothetical protein
MPATPLPVQALALILMGLGSGIFWSPLVILKTGSASATGNWNHLNLHASIAQQQPQCGAEGTG